MGPAPPARWWARCSPHPLPRKQFTFNPKSSETYILVLRGYMAQRPPVRASASASLGALLLRGWTMTADSCKACGVRDTILPTPNQRDSHHISASMTRLTSVWGDYCLGAGASDARSDQHGAGLRQLRLAERHRWLPSRTAAGAGCVARRGARAGACPGRGGCCACSVAGAARSNVRRQAQRRRPGAPRRIRHCEPGDCRPAAAGVHDAGAPLPQVRAALPHQLRTSAL